LSGPSDPTWRWPASSMRWSGDHPWMPVLFNQVADHPGCGSWRVCAPAERTSALALGSSRRSLLFELARAIGAIRLCRRFVDEAPCQEVVEHEVDLHQLPVLTHLLKTPALISPRVFDQSRIPTMPQCQFHRLLRLDERRFAARVVEQRVCAHRNGKASERHCLWPSPSAVPLRYCWPRACPRRGPWTSCPLPTACARHPWSSAGRWNLMVPAATEIVLEGHITGQRVAEGPFPDLTGTMDVVRAQPVIEIDCITHRRSPIYHALLPAGWSTGF